MKYNLEPVNIQRFHKGETKELTDMVSVEEPLSIFVEFNNDEGGISKKSISITMRTPGNDPALAKGFLYTEGVIHREADIEEIFEDVREDHAEVIVRLSPSKRIDWHRLERNFYTTSSCGVCGKNSIEAVKTVCPIIIPQQSWSVAYSLLLGLPDKLREVQKGFELSGGIHAAAWFDLSGEIQSFQEDVGRHNALDKLIGELWESDHWPLFNGILLLSGRASFELVQKASMAGVRMILAIGAPSSLAIQLAEEYGITLVGFLKKDRFNVYTSSERIQL